MKCVWHTHSLTWVETFILHIHSSCQHFTICWQHLNNIRLRRVCCHSNTWILVWVVNLNNIAIFFGVYEEAHVFLLSEGSMPNVTVETSAIWASIGSEEITNLTKPVTITLHFVNVVQTQYLDIVAPTPKIAYMCSAGCEEPAMWKLGFWCCSYVMLKLTHPSKQLLYIVDKPHAKGMMRTCTDVSSNCTHADGRGNWTSVGCETNADGDTVMCLSD